MFSTKLLFYHHTVNFPNWFLLSCNPMEEGSGDPEWDKGMAKRKGKEILQEGSVNKNHDHVPQPISQNSFMGSAVCLQVDIIKFLFWKR